MKFYKIKGNIKKWSNNDLKVNYGHFFAFFIKLKGFKRLSFKVSGILVLLSTILLGISDSYAQYPLYFEDFSNDWKVGAMNYGGVSAAQPADGNWSWVSVGAPSNDGGSAGNWDNMYFRPSNRTF